MEEINTKQQLRADYAYCEKIIKQYSQSFYYAFSKLPAEKASAIFAIYAFCRLADDAVDNNPGSEQQLAAIQTMQDDLAAFEAGDTKDEPMWRALRDVFDRFNLKIEPFYLQLQGQRQDIDFSQPRTLADLEDYSSLVAGSVGLMLLPIIATKHADTLEEAANSLGIAMQITNILRDVGEDFQKHDRIYLPAECLDAVGYSRAQLAVGENNIAFQKLWEELAALAEERYDRFNQAIHRFDADSRQQVLLSANVYRGILAAVRESGYNCFTKRNFVSPIEMGRITAATNKMLTK